MYLPGIWIPEIQRAIHEAQMNEAEDSTRMERMDTLGEAQNQLIRCQRYLSEHKKQIAKEEKKELKAQMSALQRMIRGKKPEKLSEGEAMDIRTQTERLKSMIPGEES